MDGKKILVVGLTVTGGTGILFLVIYGGVTNNPALYTPGVGLITSAIGALLGYYFGYRRLT